MVLVFYSKSFAELQSTKAKGAAPKITVKQYFPGWVGVEYITKN